MKRSALKHSIYTKLHGVEFNNAINQLGLNVTKEENDFLYHHPELKKTFQYHDVYEVGLTLSVEINIPRKEGRHPAEAKAAARDKAGDFIIGQLYGGLDGQLKALKERISFTRCTDREKEILNSMIDGIIND